MGQCRRLIRYFKAICDTTANLFGHNNRGVKYKEGQTGYNLNGELRFNQAKSAKDC